MTPDVKSGCGTLAISDFRVHAQFKELLQQRFRSLSRRNIQDHPFAGEYTVSCRLGLRK